MRRLTDPEFKYANAATTAKPGYLHRKWSRLYPGCFKPLRARATDVVVQMKGRKRKP